MNLPYDYQYDIIAIFLSVTLIIIFMTRRVPLEKSGRIFLHFLLVNLVAATLDIISIFAINDATCMPLWLAYVSALGYLFLYNILNILYLQYIDSKCKLPKIQKVVRFLSLALYIFYGVVILSSPLTHLVAYFDENGGYHHGPIMNVLFVIPFFCFVAEIVMVIIAHDKFNPYQVGTTIFFIVAMSASVAISVVFPRALVGCVSMSIITVVAYLAYENPAYYMYKDTACLNAYAFDKYLRKQEKHGRISNKRFMLILITNRDAMKAERGVSAVNEMDLQYAIELQKIYKRNIYQYIEGCFILVTDKKDEFPHKENILAILQKINKAVNIETLVIEDIWPSETCNDVEKLMDYRITNMKPEFRSLNSEEFMKKIEEKEFEKQKIISAIQRGIANNSFQVYYQPIYDCSQKRFRSAEALIRLIDEEYGFINPETLITTAEQFGYIDDITDIVIEKVCAFLKNSKIREYGIEYIEVNLSPVCCKQKDILKKIIYRLKKYSLPYESINFEITETADMRGDDMVEKNIENIHELGFSLSVDDYGSGFASASYLIKMPISIVKIDKEILWAAMNNHWAMHILESNIRMMKALEKGIVIEGVESEEMLNTLLKIEPELFIQGYYFSKPLKEEDYLEFMEKAKT